MVDRKRILGDKLATRPLHFIWLCDCSGSMAGSKIQTLNTAIREAIPHMQRVADENPFADVLVRTITFSDGAMWQNVQPTPVVDFKWTDLRADGVTDMGKALSMVAEQLKIPPMTERALPPVLVLISDGQPTDDFASGLKALMDQPWGKKAMRLAIAIGVDAQTPEVQEVFQRFIGNPELKPLAANNPEALINRIKWASTVVLKNVSTPKDQAQGQQAPIPIPLPADDPSLANPIW